MRLLITKDLYDYWGRLKGERAAPDGAEIDPVAIRHMLPDISSSKWTRNADFRSVSVALGLTPSGSASRRDASS